MNLLGLLHFGIISLGIAAHESAAQSHMGKLTRHYRPMPAVQNTQPTINEVLSQYLEDLKENGRYIRNYLQTLYWKLDGTMDKITECTIKNDLLLNKKSQTEDLSEFSNKIISMEKKLDNLVNQMKTLGERQESDGERKILKALEEIQRQGKECAEKNVPTKHSSETEAILKALEKIQIFINKSENLMPTLNDSPAMHHESHILNTIKRQMTEEANSLALKVNSMYNDIWKKCGQLDEHFRRSSMSCDILQKDLNNCIRLSTDVPSDSFDETGNYVEIAVATFKEISNDLIRKFDKELGAIAATLTTAAESIIHFEGKQKQLEKKMSLILDKIFDTILNKAAGLSKDLKEGVETIEEKHSAIIENIKDLGSDMGTQLNQFFNKVDKSSQSVSQNFEKTIQNEMNSTQTELQTYFKTLLFSLPFRQCSPDKALPSLEDESDPDASQWSDSEETVKSIILLAIDVFNGYLTRDQFLATVNRDRAYNSVEELIMDVKGFKKMPVKFLQQLEAWDKATDLGPEEEDYDEHVL